MGVKVSRYTTLLQTNIKINRERSWNYNEHVSRGITRYSQLRPRKRKKGSTSTLTRFQNEARSNRKSLEFEQFSLASLGRSKTGRSTDFNNRARGATLGNINTTRP